MQKTAFRVFLCSFSVSLFAMSVANKALLRSMSEPTPPLKISSKNVSLFVKDAKPNVYPIKKIDLSKLDDIPDTPQVQTKEDIETTDDSIIVADDWDSSDVPFQSDDVAEATDEDEDQKIFLADVVYSQEKPLLQPEITQKVVYEPEKSPSAKHQPYNDDKLSNKAVVYAEPSGDLNDDKAKGKAVQTAKADDIPIPLVYDGSTQSSANIVNGNPDDLNHVAMKISDVPIESMVKDTAGDQKSPEKQEDMPPRDNPWLVARSNGASKNNFANKNLGTVEDKQITEALNVHEPKDGMNLASETVKNLIIPLPEKLADNEDLMPKLAYPDDSDDAKKERAMNALSLKVDKEKPKLLTKIDDDDIDMEPKTETSEKENKGIFSSLKSLLSSKGKEIKDDISKSTSKIKSKLQSGISAATSGSKTLIVPREIRMAFQVNRAEISGQTLRWVQAFATKAAQDENTYLEVRVDGSRPSALQKRRLNLLYNILTNKGVEYSKINVVYTTREPNSFILRIVNFDAAGNKNLPKTKKTQQSYIQW